MDQYTDASYKVSKLITNAYSTSFSLSIRLFAPSLRPHIYAIYGLVRVADEIVDAYKGANRKELLDTLEDETEQAVKYGYSSNPVVHAFAATAREYEITAELWAPFFHSMRMDLTTQTYDQKKYETYIDGSAEVVGLMCLKVFTGNAKDYTQLEHAARKLGSAYQKVNFLRDIGADTDELGRWYFPIGSKDTFDETTKQAILADIKQDFLVAKKALPKLPASSRRAVALSYDYYMRLLDKLDHTPAAELLKKRIRVGDTQKLLLLASATMQRTKRA